MSFGDFNENAVLNHVFGRTTFTASAALQIGLSTTAPTDAGGGITEPSGSGYARVTVDNNKTTFSVSSGGSLSNAVPITFTKATGSWGTLTHFFITDGTNFYGAGALSPSRSIGTDDIAAFAAGALTVSLN